MIRRFFISLIIIAAGTFISMACSNADLYKVVKKSAPIECSDETFELSDEDDKLKNFLEHYSKVNSQFSSSGGINVFDILPKFYSVSHHLSLTGVDHNRSLVLLYHTFLLYDHS